MSNSQGKKSLQQQNRQSIFIALLVNIALFVVVVKTDSIQMDGVKALYQQWESLAPAGLGLILSGIANEQLSDLAKSRLVFWRWNDPLPGCEAFTVHGPTDPRIDLAALQKRYGPFPTNPKEQNALWYKMYQAESEQAAITDIHRNFLFTRDYAGISFILMLVLGPAGFWFIPSLSTSTLYLGVLIAQYLLVRRAARNNGIRFVTTVLALRALAK